MSIVLEVCVDSVESAMAADEGGADRVELCSALSEGGVTPSAGLIHAVRAAVSLQVCVLVRPRGGDFHYSAGEFDVMRDDIRRAGDLGADGVAIGVLTRDGFVDVQRTAQLVSAARPMKVTFHRAFDVSADLDRSLDDLIAAGADRVLTSGGQASGLQGAARLAHLMKAAKDRIILLGAGGLRSSNVREFIQTTGVSEVHSSLRSRLEPSAEEKRVDVILGAASGGAGRSVLQASEVREFRAVLDTIAAAKRDAR